MRDFYIDQNTDFESLIRITNPVTGANVNIANSTFVGTMRKGFMTSTIAANITCEIANTANGTIRISLTPANTANLDYGRYVYNVTRVDEDGYKTKVIEGTMIIIPTV